MSVEMKALSFMPFVFSVEIKTTSEVIIVRVLKKNYVVFSFKLKTSIE